tara:strand:+ start:615 stop:896 length:282 start_codon:yes stop_codon:yes gene_type:complete
MTTQLTSANRNTVSKVSDKPIRPPTLKYPARKQDPSYAVFLTVEMIGTCVAMSNYKQSAVYLSSYTGRDRLAAPMTSAITVVPDAAKMIDFVS